ncbi:MAG: NADH-quinone oxidoreductase subunit NuoG [Chloroflexota bacterium]
MSDLITVTIDGREVQVPKGTLVVEAAKQVGIEIPVFCYHPKLKPVGACRMCLVEIEKMPRLQTACTSPVADGMVINTKSDQVTAAQTGVIELLLANHPLDCPICDKGGECPLQDNTFNFGLGTSRFTEEKRRAEKAYPLSDRILLDRERCIMCYRCVRFHQEIPGDESLAAIDRGGRTVIGTLEGETYDSPFSGNTIDICPVGALTSRQYRFRARPWDLERTPSVCAGCAVGCNTEIHSRRGDVLRLIPRENLAVNDEWLCDAGRFDSLPPLGERRQLDPMDRSSGELQPSTWDQALDRAAEVIRKQGLRMAIGPEVSNEAIWILKQMNAALDGETLALPPNPWMMQGTMQSLVGCKLIILIGLDPWLELPILALWIRKAVEAGAKLVVIGPENGLQRDTAHWIRVQPGTEGAAIHLLMTNSSAVSTEQGQSGESLGSILRGRAASVLAGPRIGQDIEALAKVRELAEWLDAVWGTAPVGIPSFGANARGLQDLAPEIASFAASSCTLRFGDGLTGARPLNGESVQTAYRSGTGDDSNAVVVLPLTHPYEQSGSFTNLEGRIQILAAGAGAPGQALADWELATRLARKLNVSVPTDLLSIRAEIAAEHPAYAQAFSQVRQVPSRA